LVPDIIMEWTIRLEAKTGSDEVTNFEVGTLGRAVDDLTADGVGLSLAEGKTLLAELQQRIVQNQIDEYVASVRVCADCLTPRRLRDRRGRTLQTLFGTVTVAAPAHPPIFVRRRGRRVVVVEQSESGLRPMSVGGRWSAHHPAKRGRRRAFLRHTR
jgi:hypothetical protein